MSVGFLFRGALCGGSESGVHCKVQVGAEGGVSELGVRWFKRMSSFV